MLPESRSVMGYVAELLPIVHCTWVPATPLQVVIIMCASQAESHMSKPRDF